MTPEQFDALAAGIADDMNGALYTLQDQAIEFARRFVQEWVKGMEPVCEYIASKYDGLPVQKWNENYSMRVGDKLYTLEN